MLDAWPPVRREPAWRAFLRGGRLGAGGRAAILWLGSPILFWPLEQMRLLLTAILP